MTYCCPDTTPEQKENAKLMGYDPYDRCGKGVFDTSPCDVLCAACLLHDELYILGGTIEDFHKANANLGRDMLILANTVDDWIDRLPVITRALEYMTIIHVVSWQYWRDYDRNTDITRMQGAAFMLEAKKWINECARRIGEDLPYPEVA